MTDKIALVTGSTGGIGSEIVKKLHALGYKLKLVDVHEERLKQQAANLQGAEVFSLDLRDSQATREFCNKVIMQGGKIDVAVINAGMIVIGDLADIAADDVSDQIQVNLTSAALIIQALAKKMKAARAGHILATVSMGSIISLKGSATYSASKFGLRGLLWAIKDELVAFGVKVTGIYPAGVDTPMLRHEATNGGSNLNFLQIPVSAERVAQAFVKAINKPKLEVYVPYSESLSARFAGFFPWILGPLYPLLEKFGEKGRIKFLKSVNFYSENNKNPSQN